MLSKPSVKSFAGGFRVSFEVIVVVLLLSLYSSAMEYLGAG